MASHAKPPTWVTILILILALPIFQLPWLMGETGSDNPAHTLVTIYPFYVILSAYLAYICYATRPLVSWILMCLMVLSHLSMAYLALNPIQP